MFKDPDLETVANQVANRCAGLPILLVPVAKGLKDNADLDAWKDALKQLSSFDRDELHSQVDSALQLSYKLLAANDIKRLFLLCAHLRSDHISTEDLFKFSFGLEFFKRNYSLNDIRRRLSKLVNDLKDSCFLLDGNKPGIVKMHDIVHSFAVSIASRNHNVFTVAPFTTLQEWPSRGCIGKFDCSIFEVLQTSRSPRSI